MAIPVEASERQELTIELSYIQSGMLLTSWAIEGLHRGSNAPETQMQENQLYEGTCFVLDLLAQRLADVRKNVNKE